MSDDYERGYQAGHDDADGFIGRHPDGAPWAALPDEDEPEPEDDFERGKLDGWNERMREEGWPTTRAETICTTCDGMGRVPVTAEGFRPGIETICPTCRGTGRSGA